MIPCMAIFSVSTSPIFEHPMHLLVQSYAGCLCPGDAMHLSLESMMKSFELPLCLSCVPRCQGELEHHIAKLMDAVS